jgi:DNA-binding SARP family transcriptional activator
MGCEVAAGVSDVRTPCDLRVRLLGPVEAHAGGHPVRLGPRKQRFVLAVLALEVNQLVPVDRLVDLMWAQSPPRTATHAVQVCVSRLRSALADVAASARTGDEPELVRRGGGYVLQADPMTIDAHRFRALAERARAVGTDRDRMDLLDEALGLWVGPALTGCASADLRERLCRGLEESRLVAIEDQMDARLRLGQHRDVVDSLTGLVGRHPTRERLVGQLMLALYRSGRPGDALGAFRDAQRLLADEFGLDPSAELRRLELAILRGDPDLDHELNREHDREHGREPGREPDHDRPMPAGRAPLPVPALLPPGLAGFVGRPDALAQLDAALAGHEAGPATSIIAIRGTPGIGKTALAVHWAHRVADRFPDGQLYVNLRGFDPTGNPLTPADVIRDFLAALGVTAAAVPTSPQAQIDVYRSRLAGTRTLVVLDNAADAEQVRPLLPGSAGCLVVVTSRSDLAGLVAIEGARPVRLDVLSPDEARQLLRCRLGPERTDAEPDAIDDLIRVSAGLPLALAVVAARAALRPTFPLATLAAGIEPVVAGLDPFDTGDRSADLRALFSWSYRRLSAGSARLFRLLALHPAPDIALPAAASLAGASTERTAGLLAELTGAHLVEEHVPGRYTFHDLLRAYAHELAGAADSPARRRAAHARLFDHYLHTAHAAAGVLDAYRDEIVSAAPRTGVTVVSAPDHGSALDWLLTEYVALLGVVEQAGRCGFDDHVWRLACTMTEFFERRGLWSDWLDALRHALVAAERLGDARALAYSHRGLGRAHHYLGNYRDAEVHHRQALRYFTGLGDRLGQARAWHSLGRFAELEGRPADALAYTHAGLELFRAVGDRPGLAKALNGVGWYHCLLGDYQQALRYCGEALALVQALGDRRVEANTWDSLGYAHHQAGDHRQAIDCYRRALALFRLVGDPYHEADASVHLGQTYADAGDAAAARRLWQRALSIFEDIGHPDAEELRAKLRGSGAMSRR